MEILFEQASTWVSLTDSIAPSIAIPFQTTKSVETANLRRCITFSIFPPPRKNGFVRKLRGDIYIRFDEKLIATF